MKKVIIVLCFHNGIYLFVYNVKHLSLQKTAIFIRHLMPLITIRKVLRIKVSDQTVILETDFSGLFGIYRISSFKLRDK